MATRDRNLPRAVLALLPFLVAGCEATSERLDSAETAIRSGRVHYQERLDRISLEWICSGMSWAKLVSLTGGDQALIDAIMKACAERTFPQVGP